MFNQLVTIASDASTIAHASGGSKILSLSLVSTGLVQQDDFNRADSNTVGNGWTEDESSAAVLRVNTNRLDHASVDNLNALIRRQSPTLPSDYILQANLQPRVTDGYCYIFSESNDRSGSNSFYDIEISVGFNTFKIRDVVSGSIQGNTSVSNTFASASTYQCRMVGELSGSDRIIRGYMSQNGAAVSSNAYDDGDLTLKATYNDTGDIGLAWYGIETHDKSAAYYFFLCGRNITITGIPTGYKIQVDSRTAVTESSGEVTINVDTWALPCTTIKLLNASDTVIATLTPDNGIWGGDSYLVS